MATLRDIKYRIRSVREIQKITRAMKMVAAAKLGKVQKKQAEFESFRRGVDSLFRQTGPEVEEEDHPFLQEREEKRIWVVVLTSDRGLCGAYNHTIERAVGKFVQGRRGVKVSLLVSGRKGWHYFRQREYNVMSLDLPDDMEKRARVFAQLVSRSYLSGEVDRVYVVSDRFRLTREKGVKTVQLLPLPREAEPAGEKKSPQNEKTGRPEKRITSYLLEPGIDSVFEQACHLYLLNRFYQFFLDSEAAEQLTRMTAMDLATSNADELIFDLTLSFNKARQEAITKELIDILGGSGIISS